MNRTEDIQAEYGVLGSMLLDALSFDRIAGIVAAEDFPATTNRTLFSVMSSMILAHKPVDVLTVHSELIHRGINSIDLQTINAIAQGGVTPRHAKRYAEAVRIASLERQLRSAIALADETADGPGELDERLERITSTFSAIAHRPGKRMPRHVSEIAINRIDYYTDLSMGNIPAAWRTGFSGLDSKLSGGMRPGKVYVLAARPKVGKTSLAAQIAMTAARDDSLPTLILTQEMPDTEVVDRGVANLGRVGYSGLLTGKLSNDDWGCITEGVEALTKLPLWIDDQGGLTLADIRAKARSVKGLKLLVIDYLQLCSGSNPNRSTNRNSEIEEISRGIKALAKELDCAVLLLSQLNRRVDTSADKRPGLSDLRDSGAIEQDADAVIFLWFARMLGEHKLIGCDVAANRSGSTGEIALDFDGSRQRWCESTESIRVTVPIKPAGSSRRGFMPDDDE